jgi:mannonate dehydratase
MIKIAEYFTATPTPLWKLAAQAGVTHAVGTLPAVEPGEAPWDAAPMGRMKDSFEKAGLELAVIEATPPMQMIRLGLPGRDEEIEQFCTMIRSMGAVGVPVICYNFMAIFGWLRTHVNIPARGGAMVTGYRDSTFNDGTITEYGIVPEERLWDNLEYFLHRVIPVAEKAGVKLAMHPDDPPLSPLRGIGRIMRTIENFERLLELVPSEANGITMCQGNFTLMTDDLPPVIRRFGKQGRIHFVHFRDVQGTPDDFVETFHEIGKTDMLACMKVYQEIGFEGVLRPDHVPTMEGDSNDNPCYSTIGRLLAIGYITGLREAVYGKSVQEMPDRSGDMVR